MDDDVAAYLFLLWCRFLAERALEGIVQEHPDGGFQVEPQDMEGIILALPVG